MKMLRISDMSSPHLSLIILSMTLNAMMTIQVRPFSTIIVLIFYLCDHSKLYSTDFIVGFPILGIEWQKMENPDLRKALGMISHQKGVRVRRVEPTAPAAKYLQSSDVLLSFDDIDVANDGTGTNYIRAP